GISIVTTSLGPSGPAATSTPRAAAARTLHRRIRVVLVIVAGSLSRLENAHPSKHEATTGRGRAGRRGENLLPGVATLLAQETRQTSAQDVIVGSATSARFSRRRHPRASPPPARKGQTRPRRGSRPVPWCVAR